MSRLSRQGSAPQLITICVCMSSPAQGWGGGKGSGSACGRECVLPCKRVLAWETALASNVQQCRFAQASRAFIVVFFRAIQPPFPPVTHQSQCCPRCAAQAQARWGTGACGSRGEKGCVGGWRRGWGAEQAGEDQLGPEACNAVLGAAAGLYRRALQDSPPLSKHAANHQPPTRWPAGRPQTPTHSSSSTRRRHTPELMTSWILSLVPSLR